MKRDNVIYANFTRAGKRTTPKSPVPMGESTNADVARRGAAQAASEPPEPQRFLRMSEYLYDTVVRDADPRRIQRGRHYYQEGRVRNVIFARGRINGEVAGSQLEPFQTSLVFGTMPKGMLSDTIGEQVRAPRGVEKLDEGRALLTCLKRWCTGILPRCDCPDGAAVCKHVVALSLAAKQEIDREPARFLRVHGINLALLHYDMEDSLYISKDKEQEPDFWNGSILPELPQPKTTSVLEEANWEALARAMRAGSYSAVEQLRATSDIEDLYDFLRGTHHARVNPPEKREP